LGDNLVRIDHGDRDWHERFFAFIETMFRPGSTFRRWAERGGWQPGYEVFAIERDGQILSTVGRQRMHFVINGEQREGYQLGAVASRPDHRGRGLSRRVLTWALSDDDAPTQPIILFANKSVLDFYPRFGFRRIAQKRFVANAAIEPAARQARTIDLGAAADRARLSGLCRRARAVGDTLSARDYYSTLLWHLTYKPRPVFWFEEFGAALIASVDRECLILDDLIATRPFDLARALPCLIHHPVKTLEFRFSPEGWWPEAQVLPADETDSPLFVRGLPPLSTDAFRFPDLAQT
jgi:predicted N-acetyltransferase YhbS